MHHVHVKPETFQHIMLGTKKQLIVGLDYIAGDIVRVHLNDHGTGPPWLECKITHIEELPLAGPCANPENPDHLFIASINRGLDW